MKPGGATDRSAWMKEHEIDDRDLAADDPADPASLQHVDAILCPECRGAGATSEGETCPVCDGTGRATGRTGGG
jgi:RecJ-like exonuclease